MSSKINNTTKEVYLCLNPRFRLHLLPNGGIVFLHSSSTAKLEKDVIYRLNHTASQILEMCNCKSTIKDIAFKLIKEYDEENDTIITGMSDFILWALEKDILTMHTESDNINLEITGSRDYCIPMQLSIELTDSCNLNCKHCYRDSSSKCNSFLDSNLLYKILDFFSRHGLQSIELTGGECTIHPDFAEIFDYCAKTFDLVAVLTNGYYLNNKVLELMKKYKDKIIVQIDLDGHKPEIHDWLRGKDGSFKKTLHNISIISKNNIKLRVAMNIHADNYKYIENVADLAYKLGVTWFSFSPILDIGRGQNINLISETEFLYCGKLIKKLKEKYGDFFFAGDEIKNKSIIGPKENCGAGWKSQVLGPTGKLRPCLMFDEDKYTLGDLSITSTEDLLASLKETTNFFQSIRPPDYSICGDCNNFKFCYGCIVRPLIALEYSKKHTCAWTKHTCISNYIDITEVAN